MFQLLSSTAADELVVPVVPALGGVPRVASCAPPIPALDREVPTHPVPVDYSCRSD